jgi:LSD1 subclass zinc finger protein
MRSIIHCPGCRKPLTLPESASSKQVRCPACQTIFPAAGATPQTAVTKVAAPPAPPVDDRVSQQPRVLFPVDSSEEEVPWAESANQSSASWRGDPLEFKAVVRNDPDKDLKGIFQCLLSADGLRLRQGQKQDIHIAVGVKARYLGGDRFAVPIEGRTVEWSVAGWTIYTQRLARDLCRFLAGERRPLAAGEYSIPLYLFVPAVLPLGIPLLTLGGALWGALGCGLAGACLGIARREQWPPAVRLTLSLLLTFAGYLVVGAVLLFSLKPQWFGNNPQPSTMSSTQAPPEPGQGFGQPLPKQEWGNPPPDFKGWHLLPDIEQHGLNPPPPLLEAAELRIITTADKASLVQVRFAANGKTVAALDLLGSCRLWDRNTGKELASIRLANQNLVNWLAFSPDGKYLVAWDGKEPLCLRDAATGEVVSRINMDKEDPKDFYSRWTHGDFSPDGKILAISRGRSVKFWSVPDGAAARHPLSLVSQPGDYFYTVHFGPDGKSLMTVNYTVKPHSELERLDQVWDLEGKSPTRRLVGFKPGQVWDRLTFSPDRKLAVLRTYHFMQVLDWAVDKFVVTLEGSANCDSVAVTPDGKTLLSGHVDGTVRLWELPGGKALGRFKVRLPKDFDITRGVCVDVSPDNQMLATAHGNTVTLWKFDTIFPKK